MSTEGIELTNVRFSGTLYFTCCSKSHTVIGDFRSTVKCPICGALYDLALNLSLSLEQKFPKGSRVKLKEEYKTTAGSTLITVHPGTYIVYQDKHQMMRLPPDFTLLEVIITGGRGDIRTLLISVPDHLLELYDGQGDESLSGKVDRN